MSEEIKTKGTIIISDDILERESSILAKSLVKTRSIPLAVLTISVDSGSLGFVHGKLGWRTNGPYLKILIDNIDMIAEDAAQGLKEALADFKKRQTKKD